MGDKGSNMRTPRRIQTIRDINKVVNNKTKERVNNKRRKPLTLQIMKVKIGTIHIVIKMVMWMKNVGSFIQNFAHTKRRRRIWIIRMKCL